MELQIVMSISASVGLLGIDAIDLALFTDHLTLRVADLEFGVELAALRLAVRLAQDLLEALTHLDLAWI